MSQREELKLAFVLQDLRRNWSEDESLLLQWLAEQSVPGRIVLTKTDKLKLMKRKERIKKLKAEIGSEFGNPIATSSQKGDGLDVIWKTCFEHAFPERAAAAAKAREASLRGEGIQGDAAGDTGAIDDRVESAVVNKDASPVQKG